MSKKGNRYRLTLELLEKTNGEKSDREPLNIEVLNHDEIFSIIERIKQKNLFDDAASTEFAVGLKLFSEVMLRHRSHPLFEELAPAFGAFMTKLKAM